ncbi:hypothetical protein HPB47_023459 [Ixodes persulcatus]|uniref:Uncharacterized protein n=1 Tax=Ixodes persulcatus TaxID=34615 RepID=A0AC60Q8V9_IXOPE|nr:hypothetical protein HPB47_023459 [Ixodes persulcatus]
MPSGDVPPRNAFERFYNGIYNLWDTPVTWFREKVVAPNRKQYYWYHRQLPRVPEIDQCYTDDLMCKFEANEQYKRDRDVDTRILQILSRRRDDCYVYESPETEKCKKLHEDFREAELNWFIKYGDLGPHVTVVNAFMKQKHRLVAERRRALKEQQEAEEGAQDATD